MRKNKTRKFEFVSRMMDKEFLLDERIILPKRATENSAGYDFVNPERVIIPVYKRGDKPFKVKTGIKVKMQNDEVLKLYNRSSNPEKRNLILANGVGIIDADYYNNPINEGEIMFPFYNIGNEPVTLELGEKLGQGVFGKYLITDDDNAEGERVGGFGSTGK